VDKEYQIKLRDALRGTEITACRVILIHEALTMTLNRSHRNPQIFNAYNQLPRFYEGCAWLGMCLKCRAADKTRGEVPCISLITRTNAPTRRDAVASVSRLENFRKMAIGNDFGPYFSMAEEVLNKHPKETDALIKYLSMKMLDLEGTYVPQ